VPSRVRRSTTPSGSWPIGASSNASNPPARYQDRVGDNHHHLICRTCGLMVDGAIGATPVSPPPTTRVTKSTKPRWCTGAAVPPVGKQPMAPEHANEHGWEPATSTTEESNDHRRPRNDCQQR
jgi:hypothetical protein